MSADGYIADGIVYLSKPLEGEFKVTPQLGKHVLSDLSGVFRSVVAADQPLILKIEPESFTLPIRDFSWKNVNISGGVVNLGKTEFEEKEILSAPPAGGKIGRYRAGLVHTHLLLCEKRSCPC